MLRLATVALGGPGIAAGKVPAHTCNCPIGDDGTTVEHTDECGRERRFRIKAAVPHRELGAFNYPTTHPGMDANTMRRLLGKGGFVAKLWRWEDVARAARVESCRGELFGGTAAAIGAAAVAARGRDCIVELLACSDEATDAALGLALVNRTAKWCSLVPPELMRCMQCSDEGKRILVARKKVDDAIILDGNTDGMYSVTCDLGETIDAILETPYVENSSEFEPIAAAAYKAADAITARLFEFRPTGGWVVDALVWGPDHQCAQDATDALPADLRADAEALALFFYSATDLRNAHKRAKFVFTGTSAPTLTTEVFEQRARHPDAAPYQEAIKAVVRPALSQRFTVDFEAVIKEGCTPVAVSWSGAPRFVAKAPDAASLGRAASLLRADYKIEGGPGDYSTHERHVGVWGRQHSAPPPLRALDGLFADEDTAHFFDAPVVSPSGKTGAPSAKVKEARRQTYCISLLQRGLKLYGMHYISRANTKDPTIARLHEMGFIVTHFDRVRDGEITPSDMNLKDALHLGLALNPTFHATPAEFRGAMTQVLHPHSSAQLQLGLVELRSTATSALWVYGPRLSQTVFDPICAFHAARMVERHMPQASTTAKSAAAIAVLFGKPSNTAVGPIATAIKTGVDTDGRRVRAFYDRRLAPLVVFHESHVKPRLAFPDKVREMAAAMHNFFDATQSKLANVAVQKGNLPRYPGTEDVYRDVHGKVASTPAAVDLTRLIPEERTIFRRCCEEVLGVVGCFLLPKLSLKHIFSVRAIVLYGESGAGKSTLGSFIGNYNDPDTAMPVDGNYNGNQFTKGIEMLHADGVRGLNGKAYLLIADMATPSGLGAYSHKADTDGERTKTIEVKGDPKGHVFGLKTEAQFVDRAWTGLQPTGYLKTPEQKAFSEDLGALCTRTMACANNFDSVFPELLLGDRKDMAKRMKEADAWGRRVWPLRLLKLQAGGQNAVLDQWVALDTVDAHVDAMRALMAFGRAVEQMRQQNTTEITTLHTFPCEMHGLAGCPADCKQRRSFFGFGADAAFAEVLKPKIDGAIGAAVRLLRRYFSPAPGLALTTQSLIDAMNVFAPAHTYTYDTVATAVNIVFNRQLTTGHAVGVQLCQGSRNNPYGQTATYECNCDAAGKPADLGKHVYDTANGCCDQRSRITASVVLGLAPAKDGDGNPWEVSPEL